MKEGERDWKKGHETIRDMEEKFTAKDVPENRMRILQDINKKKEEIASNFVSVLCQEQLTVNEAISILKSAELIIMQSKFTT
ncbi:hypothetical protein [Desulfosporosinus sp. FKB]|uniref:hypothetical protein n=1 Tax=Desulfosporosinus sp. FKB TaxID=1969835 RepID=UPI0014837DBC|nr:hypothetical protein [Desulfosporosinus sp. FKB]